MHNVHSVCLAYLAYITVFGDLLVIDGYQLLDTIPYILDDRYVFEPNSSLDKPGWIPQGTQFPFRARRGTSACLGVLVLRRVKDRKKLFVLMGSRSDFRIGFDLATSSGAKCLGDFERLFAQKHQELGWF